MRDPKAELLRRAQLQNSGLAAPFAERDVEIASLREKVALQDRAIGDLGAAVGQLERIVRELQAWAHEHKEG